LSPPKNARAQVFPKTLDSLLLLLYAAVLVPLAFTRYRFLSDWGAVLHFGAASMFIWVRCAVCAGRAWQRAGPR
jgi:hypothetical protein